jgi:hypothetical protein
MSKLCEATEQTRHCLSTSDLHGQTIMRGNDIRALFLRRSCTATHARWNREQKTLVSRHIIRRGTILLLLCPSIGHEARTISSSPCPKHAPAPTPRSETVHCMYTLRLLPAPRLLSDQPLPPPDGAPKIPPLPLRSKPPLHPPPNLIQPPTDASPLLPCLPAHHPRINKTIE